MAKITREDLEANLWRLSPTGLGAPNDPVKNLLDNIGPLTLEAVLTDLEAPITLALDSKKAEIYQSLQTLVKDLPADDPLRLAVEGVG